MQNSSSVLHLILVGFHHRKGSVVELIYPPIANETFQEKSQLPHSWRHLPSLAIADGAHNYAKDCTYFTLPSSEKKDETVFGVACYRQANSASYVQPNPEITRNTVQKSLVVLSRFPLFGFIAHHLAKITDFLLKKKGFTQESLRNSYEELSIIVESVLNNPMSYQDALFYNLNAANFVRVYKRNALCLFKLLLLERRILFTGDSGGIVSNWILTLLSLYPDMLRGGLLQCSVVDSSWTSECLCCSNTNNSDTTNLTFAASMNDGSPFNITEQFSRSVQETTVQDEQQNRNLPSVKNEHAWFTDVQHTSYVNPSSAGDSLSQKDSTTSMTGLNQSLINPQTISLSEKITNSPLSEFSLYSPFPTDDWGFPLSLFTKSYLAPIYIPLGLLDTLLEPASFISSFNSSVTSSIDQNRAFTDRSVRGFVAGATNPLLRSNKHLTEVFVSSLSPVEGIPEVYFPHLSELTSAFDMSSVSGMESDTQLITAVSENTTKSLSSSFIDGEGNVKNLTHRIPTNVSQPFLPPKKSQPVIQINSENSANKHPTNPRSMPAPLNRAVQLSRVDRLFIDHLISTVNMWFSAQIDYCQRFSHRKGELITCDSLHGSTSSNHFDEDILLQLLPIQRTFLLRFPSQAVLDAWIRQQFLIYLRALLLSAQGYNSCASDFHPAYLTCLRSTRSFSLWCYQFSPGQLFSISVPEPLPQNTVIKKVLNEPSAGENNEERRVVVFEDTESLQLQHSCTTSPNSVAAVVSQHPGRKITEPDDWNQFADGFKKLGNMAADQGRRFVNQSVAGLVKLGSEFNSTFRASSSSNFLWKFSDAFKSVILNPASVSSPIVTTHNTETVNVKREL